MKLLLCIVFVSLAVLAIQVEALNRLDGVTKCRMGPFIMEARECTCASDGKHVVCEAVQNDPPAKSIEKVEGTTQCEPGPYNLPDRECHCASDYKHFTCPQI